MGETLVPGKSTATHLFGEDRILCTGPGHGHKFLLQTHFGTGTGHMEGKGLICFFQLQSVQKVIVDKLHRFVKVQLLCHHPFHAVGAWTGVAENGVLPVIAGF